MRTLLISSVISLLLITSSYQVNAGTVRGWHLEHIGLTKELQDKVLRQQRAIAHVGVLDGGAMWWHQEVDGRTTYIANPANCPLSDKYWYLPGTCLDNHGTHVLTTIGASNTAPGEMVGVHPTSRLYSFSIFGSEGFDSTYGRFLGMGVDRQWRDIYDWFIEKRVTVTNHSYGFTWNAYGAAELRLIAEHRNRHNVFVWAAGNDYKHLRNIVMQDNFQLSEKIDNLILVVALSDEDGKLADFSSTPGESGVCNISTAVCLEENKFKYHVVAAPGEDICAGQATGSGTDYHCGGGTSYAAPIVTGVVALMQSRWPALKRDAGKVTEIIFKTAQDLGEPGVDNIYGWGLIRADRALGPLGKTYLSFRQKRFGLAKAKLKVSSALSALTQQRVSFFDAYDRDFEIPLATYAPSYQGILENWMENSVDYPETTSIEGGGLSYSFSARDYNPLDPSLSDIEWGMSYQKVDGNTFHFGQGSALDRLDLPGSLSFGLMADKTIQAGAYPVMGLAEGGVYALIERSMNSGFTMTGGALTNAGLTAEAHDRNYAPKADALMLSLGRVSQNKKLTGSISATYLVEEDGVLGTGGAGGLGFIDGSDSQAITVGSSYQLNDDFKISTAYTGAFSRGDTTSGKLLSLDSPRLVSTAFTVGLESKNLLSDTDRLHFSVSQPLRVNGGSMSLMYDEYYDEDEILHTRRVDIDLASTGRQIDYQLQYIFAPKQKAVTVGLFAYYADDYLHQANATDYGAGLRIQGNF